MSRNSRRSGSRKHRRDGGFHRMRARTNRMHAGVRLAVCGLVLTACCAFMVSALPHHRKLNQLRADLGEVQAQETMVIERKDAKQRELEAIEKDPSYLELIARDRLNYYKAGEHIFRIERE